MTETEHRNFFRRNAGLKGFTARIATERDIEPIIALSRLTHKAEYSTDYLPGWLPKLLEDEHRILIVVEKNTQMVGVGMLLGGLDNGEFLVGEAGRVDPSVQGLHLVPFIIWHLLAEAEKRWPAWKTMIGGGTQTQFLDSKKDVTTVISKRMILKIRLPNMNHTALSEKAVKRLSKGHCFKVQTEDSFARLLAEETTCSSIYPDGIISVEHLAYKALPGNVHHIFKYHDNVISSSKWGTDAAVDAVSIGGILPCDDHGAWRYNFNYSGTPDMNIYLWHLEKHLQSCSMVSVNNQTLYLVLMAPYPIEQSYGQERILDNVADFLEVFPSEVTIMRQYLVRHLLMKEDFLNWREQSSNY